MNKKFQSIKELKNMLKEKAELFKKWFFEDKTLIKNYSNYYVEYQKLEAKLQQTQEILKIIDRPIKIYGKSEEDKIIIEQGIKIDRNELKNQIEGKNE